MYFDSDSALVASSVELLVHLAILVPNLIKLCPCLNLQQRVGRNQQDNVDATAEEGYYQAANRQTFHLVAVLSDIEIAPPESLARDQSHWEVKVQKLEDRSYNKVCLCIEARCCSVHDTVTMDIIEDSNDSEDAKNDPIV